MSIPPYQTTDIKPMEFNLMLKSSLKVKPHIQEIHRGLELSHKQ